MHAVITAGQWTGFAVWFAVAIIGHDLLLFPLYSLADLSLRHLLPGGSHGRLPAPKPAARGPFEAFQRRGHRGAAGSAAAVPRQRASGAALARLAWPPLLNYVRIPVIFSLLLLMTFFPMILGLSEPELHRASGLGTGPYLWRWLGVTGVMFAISAAAYALRTRRATAGPRRPPKTPRPPQETHGGDRSGALRPDQAAVAGRAPWGTRGPVTPGRADCGLGCTRRPARPAR